ncbi:LLM class flavin-dependent oxidoreductase [Promicromonospora sp. NPDC057138]|uniref:LLM class flavin-dependent oxidoreductase n=1 Tax=Promicromonospora sp. NPDC057138 TaxID=3346031 RepID=UPI00363D189B
MDYRHELRFGSFITPANEDPQRTVDLAVESERAGLDLVTFQDHPYQRRFLDTWTLLSYVAARTERVSLAPNVANLPLRPPAVLARSAAALDALTGGRVELGLGAGAFWDAIEAMGGRRLAPGQAVQATREAIGVIHSAWGRGPARVEGEFYWARGAKPGTQPAHDIGIWIGAYRPRMLELTGTLADGWLPSVGRLSAQEMTDANARLDDAAVAAGRNPADVVRIANISGPLSPQVVPEWVDRLTALTLKEGFSTYILDGDDPAGLQLIGQEIAPAVREAVAAERG